MDYIKRKILLENYVSRVPDDNYGKLTADSFYLKITLNQTIDDLGMFTDIPYLSQSANYSQLIDKMYSLGLAFPFMVGETPQQQPLTGFTKNLRVNGLTVDDLITTSSLVTGMTNSKIERVRGYNNTTPFIPGLDIIREEYLDYTGTEVVSGVSRVITLSNPTAYTFDVDVNDFNIGTPLQKHGILYNDSVNLDLGLIEGDNLNETKFSFQGQGWNRTNISLSAITKEEIFLGVVFPPDVQSDVFIDRGKLNIYDLHLRLSEVESIEHLLRYGNGFYNIKKQL